MKKQIALVGMILALAGAVKAEDWPGHRAGTYEMSADGGLTIKEMTPAWFDSLVKTNTAFGGDVTGTIGATVVDAGITRDTEWNSAAKINAATTDADFLTAIPNPFTPTSPWSIISDIVLGTSGGGTRRLTLYSGTAGQSGYFECNGSTTYMNGSYNLWIAGGYDVTLKTGAGRNADLIAGGLYQFKDRDASDAVRATIDSATGAADFGKNGGGLSINAVERISNTGAATFASGTSVGAWAVGTGGSGDLTVNGVSRISNAGRGTLAGVTNSGTYVPTPLVATIDANSDQIPCTAELIYVNLDMDHTLTSTPTIPAGTEGQVLRVFNRELTRSLTLQDNGTLAGSQLILGAATHTILPGKSALFIYATGFDASGCWLKQ